MRSINQELIVKDLVLIGGGHAHVAVLKRFGMNPVSGLQITLIAKDIHVPYSGMLPGYITGEYDFDDMHIDLQPLAQFASARIIDAEATGIDTHNNEITCQSRPPIPYDLLSINIGGTPIVPEWGDTQNIGVGVKPVDRFIKHWSRLLEKLNTNSAGQNIFVVGAGAGGVELVLAMHARLQSSNLSGVSLHLVCKGDAILPAYPSKVGFQIGKLLETRGINLHTDTTITSANPGELCLSNGKTFTPLEVFYSTPVKPAPWLKNSGLEVDESGFLKVHDTLQLLSHPEIFAAGDIASIVNYPRAKAGVHAVRQGKILEKNLRRSLFGQAPKPYTPQKTTLALLGTSDGSALAIKGSLHTSGRLWWSLKKMIDRKFIESYNNLPPMPENTDLQNIKMPIGKEIEQALQSSAMRCGGCGAKVDAGVLDRTLKKLNLHQGHDLIVGLNSPDDAAVFEIPSNKLLVQSVDYFKSIVKDPYLFGKIAANHSCNDIFAMGGKPISALAIATIPYGLESKTEALLYQMLSGAKEVLDEAGAALIGGHSSEGTDLALGFTVNGLVEKNEILHKSTVAENDVLILTKALGTGTLFAADMKHKAKGRWIQSAIHSMTTSNRAAAECFSKFGATACTDISGFGLAGHLSEMIRPTQLEAQLYLDHIPVLDGALEMLGQGLMSSMHQSNEKFDVFINDTSTFTNERKYPLLFDPQTAGGLLASIPSSMADECLKQLETLGYQDSAIIGIIHKAKKQKKPITLVSNNAKQL